MTLAIAFPGKLAHAFGPGSLARPDTFGAKSGVERNTATVSRRAYLEDIPAGAAVTAGAGAEYSLDGAAFTVIAGVWGTSKHIRARATSSGSFATKVTATITVNAVAYTFDVTTRAANTVPNAFSFTDATSVELSTVTESDAITVAGIEAASNFTVTGGEAEKNDSGTWAASGSVVATDTVKVRGTSSASYEAAVNVVLTIGGVSDTFSITTRAAVTTPDAFSFTDVTGANLSTLTESDAITVAGIETAVSYTVTGGEAQKNGAGAWGSSGTVVATDTVKVRATSSASYSTAVNVVLAINAITDTFTITTKADPGSGAVYWKDAAGNNILDANGNPIEVIE